MATIDADEGDADRLQYKFNGDGDLHFRDKGHASRIISGILDSGESTSFQDLVRETLTEISLKSDNTEEDFDRDTTSYHHATVLDIFREFRRTGRHCDVTLCVGERAIPCHRAVLAAGSPYFKLLLLGGFAESCQERVRLEEVSAESVERIVCYVYSGCLTVSRGTAEELLHSSTMFQLPAVTEACCRFFLHNLDPENCFDIQALAESYYCSELAKDVRGYVMNNFPAISNTERFELLTCGELVDILTSKTCHWSKETLLESVLNWVKSSKDERLGDLPVLLSKLDLRLIKETYLENVLRRERVLTESEESAKIVAAAKTAIEDLKPKEGDTEVIVQVGGLSGSEKVQNTPGVYGNATDKITEVDCLDPATMRWASLTHLPGHLKYFTHNVTASDADVYVLATSEDEQVTEAWRYMTQSNVWARLPGPRHHHRGSVAMATLERRIYVIGDRLKAGADVTTNEVYSPSANQWEAVPHVHVGVFKITMVTCGGKLYLLGYSGDDGIVRVQTYSPGDESWEVFWVPDYHAMKRQFQTMSCGSLIYLMPISRAYKMYALDTHYRSWVQVHNPKQSHLQCGWTTLGGRIWLTGGREFHFYHNPHIECYDPDEQTWTIMGAQTSGIRRGHVCVHVSSCDWIAERLSRSPSGARPAPAGDWGWMDELLAAQWSQYGLQSSMEFGLPLDIDSE
ncbi:PREDICTED: kelch-like protein 21 [Branchiostoma belcheri]|uniref:Kelch-like protein 21 n=1 Tax=Branchiostoma belcheri TaxID=7741 RepID=A0A6P5A7Y8_BRABE|nr:PREDICTED: kelch-like protein 21 [Branchiostoma belcheri]